MLEATRTKLVVIGASTGGPRALSQLFCALPATLPVPVAVVVHMPPGSTEAFAKHLDRACMLDVVEASDGLLLRAGLVVIARAGVHMRLHQASDGLHARLDAAAVGSLHCPSVDVLFTSASRELKGGVLGVVLTGIGNDGVVGARAISVAGGRVLVEHASTCVEGGMPRAVSSQGLAEAELPLHEIAAGIVARL